MSSPSASGATKRPLEDSPSPNVRDEHDSKRIKDEGVNNEKRSPSPIPIKVEADPEPSTTEEENAPAPAPAEADTVVPDAPNQSQIQGNQAPADESQWIHIRALITSAEAATVIGKGGENVTQIRKMAEAKCTVSDYQRGAGERILTVSGAVDAVAKAFGLIIRTLNNEPLDQASSPQSKTYPLRLLVPHILIGSIIGKAGSRIREIQEASGARLNASGSTLPLSTERSLVVTGVADAVHIATYYIANTLVEQLTERYGGPAASAYATRTGGPAGPIPGGMQVIPYQPQPLHGSYGHPETFKRHNNSSQRTPANPYGVPYLHGAAPAPVPAAPIHYPNPSDAGAYSGAGPHPTGQPVPTTPSTTAQTPLGMLPGQPLTQQIFIPNDMVGAIIGKGGAKINEIRQLSGSVIKINEPQDNSNERLVTITGTQECNQMALYMLYSRLESEKHRI
jgi:heterogeneous nuclear rnp K-like protein 2